MKKLRLSDVQNIYEYEKIRGDVRRNVIELKRWRRVPVGEHFAFIFENRETVLFQIQEMCRAERIVEDARVQDEVDVYNELIPEDNQLSATLMIEVGESSQIRPVLDRLMGIDVGEHVWIQVGKEFSIPGEFEAGRSDEERGKISAVHFVRFKFPLAAIRALHEQDAYLVVDHPGEQARTRLSDEVKASLLKDLEV